MFHSLGCHKLIGFF